MQPAGAALPGELSGPVKQMVSAWVDQAGGDTERAAQWMCAVLGFADIATCRRFVAGSNPYKG